MMLGFCTDNILCLVAAKAVVFGNILVKQYNLNRSDILCRTFRHIKYYTRRCELPEGGKIILP